MLCAVLLPLVGLTGASAAPPKSDPPRAEPGYSKVEIRGTIGQGSEPDPSPFQSFQARGYLTIKVEGEGEWRLDLDEAAEKVLSNNVGKQVTIIGSLRYQSIRVKTVNGLELK
jgi:hypothetical protein